MPTSLGLQGLKEIMHINTHSTEPGTEVSQNINYYLRQRLLHQYACSPLFPGTQVDYISQLPIKLIVVISG